MTTRAQRSGAMLNRRTALLGLGALAAGAAAPSWSRIRGGAKPPPLRPGDTIGLVAPAGAIDGQEAVDEMIATITAMGFRAKPGRHVTALHGYLAGTDAERADDFNAMFADDEVRALFAVRGGWGSARILPLLDWRAIRSRPKLLVGFSDITALHLAFAARAGYPTLHAPNAGSSWREISWNNFWALAVQGATPTLRNPETPGGDLLANPRWTTTTIRPGVARGRLLGGNLAVLAALVGTPWLPDFDGAILFLEDVNEAEYRVDRMLTQLGQAGILKRVAGIVFGQCTRCATEDADYAGFTLPQVLTQHIAPLGIPAFHGANIGHVANQLSLPSGTSVEIDAEAGSIRILEPMVG